jgi:hypothetical protein
MRLTLRTLLAWLDDTLQPAEVKQIGSQVAGSPFAQELTDRIHRVTRQRRLSVPHSSGPDGVDANLVANYLDNELDAEEVAEYEKKCLSHDVILAEVASVHQILSLLGHKVKVPTAARSRMYQLVKGREATRTTRASKSRADQPEPVTKPINPWVVPEAPRRSALERFGPAVACLLLIGLCGTAAWMSLTARPADGGFGTGAAAAALAKAGLAGPKVDQVEGTVADQDSPTQVADAMPAVASTAEGPRPADAGGAEPADAAGQPLDPAGAGAAKATDGASKSAEAVAKMVVPAGSAGLAAAVEGILLRYNSDSRAWERLTGPTPLAVSNRLLCLFPSRATIRVGKTQVVMIGECEIRILPQSTEAVPAIELSQGWLAFRPESSGTLKVGVGDRIVTLEVPPNGGAALERSARWVYGRLVSPVAPLVIHCKSGDVSVTVGNKQETLSPFDALLIDRTGVKRSTDDALPEWANESWPSPEEIKARDQFAKIFHPGRPVLAEIVAAVEEKNADIKQLAIAALKSMGEMSYLMPLLSRKDDPAARRSALAATRSYTALGPEASAKVREQLVEEFGEDTASVAGKMIVGFSTQEAASQQLIAQLVKMLSPEEVNVGVRELALDTLKRLTGRDDQGYDPDHPEGKGLSTWVDLERQGKLRPAAAPRAKAK